MTKISDVELEKKTIEVLGKKMTYVEKGEGNPIIFQHGNPTSSYLWRNIIPHLEDQGRCIAIDLIGMGDSDKLDDKGDDTYSYHIHKKYFDACLKELGIKNDVALVIHDWGSSLGFNWAYENKESIKGICYMEGIVMPISWNDWPENAKSISTISFLISLRKICKNKGLISGSSSTTRIRLVLDSGSDILLIIFKGKFDFKAGSFGFFGIETYRTSVSIYNYFISYRQAKASTLIWRFCSEKWIKDIRFDISGNANSIIFDLNDSKCTIHFGSYPYKWLEMIEVRNGCLFHRSVKRIIE